MHIMLDAAGAVEVPTFIASGMGWQGREPSGVGPILTDLVVQAAAHPPARDRLRDFAGLPAFGVPHGPSTRSELSELVTGALGQSERKVPNRLGPETDAALRHGQC